MKILTLLLILLPFLSLNANEAKRRTLVGQVVSVTYDDLSESFGITQDQERYSFRVQMDTMEIMTLGFGKPGKEITESDKMKFKLLLDAMDNQYTVALRLDSVITTDFIPSHARIIAVSVKP
jgi:hypothetical protein